MAIFSAAALGLLALVAGFNAWIDPFAMYRWSIQGADVYKPAIQKHLRLFKAYEVRHVQPGTVILGTSRTHLGIGCSHEAFKQLEGPCYNLAFDGATTREMYHYMRHAHAIRPLKHVVLGLDAYHPVTATSFTRPDFDPLLLDGAPSAWLPRWLSADLRLLTSLATLRASIDTITAQGRREPNWFTPEGQRLGEVFFRRPGENFVRNGPRGYFDEIDRLEIGFQTEGLKAGARNVEPKAEYNPEETSLAYIREIVDFCLGAGIDLRIFITPSHVHQIEISSLTGGWAAIENGKRLMVRLLDEAHVRYPARNPVPLHDFSGYSSITTEALPDAEGSEEMRFYWDSSHFKANVGDLVLDRLFGMPHSSRAAPPDFGILLTASTIENSLAQQRVAQAAYRERCEQEIEQLRALVQARAGVKSVEPLASAAAWLR